MKGQLRIDQMFAFIVLDEDGTEGIPAVEHGEHLVPLVGADMARVSSLRAIVLADPRLKGYRVTLVTFTHRETLEVIDRTQEGG